MLARAKFLCYIIGLLFAVRTAGHRHNASSYFRNFQQRTAKAKDDHTLEMRKQAKQFLQSLTSPRK
jgi:hypothetical protein